MVKYPEIDDLSNGSKRNQKYIHIHYPGFEEYILSNFNFCKTWIEKLYCYFYRIKSTPKCPVCGSDVQFKSFTAGYHSFCSTSCVSKSESIKSKKKQTCISNYGVEYASQSEDVKIKKKQTYLDRYGVDNPMKNGKFKAKCETRSKQSTLKKYGVECVFQSKEIQDKIKQTNLERYGADAPFQSKEIQDKIKQTNLERYGAECVFRSKEIQDKIKQTNLERYGVECVFRSKEIQDKIKQTNLERYGVEVSQRSALLRSKLSTAHLSDEVKLKTSITNLKKYGVSNPSRSKTIQSKINNTKRSNDTFNTSKIEEEFASYLDQNHIIYKRQYKSDLYPFNCDFYLPDYELYIEVQGSWTHGHHPYNIELDKETLNKWILKQSKYYNNAIKVWTKKDPLKRETAKLNNLNYLEIFSSKLDIVIIWFQQYITELLNCPNVKQSLVKAYI